MSQTASNPNQQIRIRPTLILGLGGFGGEVLLKIRRRFYEQHGSLDEFPIVAYRWLDTDGKRPESLGEIPDAIKLSDTERINLSISDPSSITANLKEPSHDHIAPWWYPGLSSLSAMNEGVSKIRVYGRLAFFHHYNLIRSAVVDAQTKIRDPLTQEAMMKSRVLRQLGLSAQVDFNSPTNVILISTISGGTGSGMLLDLTFMIKELLGEGNISSCAYLVFPEVNDEDDHQGRANGYAFLKELNHYQYGVTHYQAEWSRGQRVKVPTPPLDHCYLFDQLGAEKNQCMTEATQELLAEAIFLDFRQGEFSDHKRSIRVNLKQYMSKTFDYEHPRFKQKFIQRYGSLGLSSLQIPHARIINACSAKLAAAVIQDWLEKPGLSDGPPTSRDGLLKALGLFESEQNHDILYSLLDPSGKADPETGRTRGLMHELEQWGHSLLSQFDQQDYRRQRLTLRDWLYQAYQQKERELQQGQGLPPSMQSNLQSLTNTLELRLQQLINRTLEQAGLKAVESQLTSLSSAMQQQVKRFEAHSNELQEHTRQRQNDFHKRLTELSRQQHRRNWDGRTKIVLRYLTERFLQSLIGDSGYPGLLRCQLQTTLLRAGVEVSKNVLTLLQGQARADGQRNGGLQVQVQILDRELRLLQEDLVIDSLAVEAASLDPYTTSLYQAGDLESKYFPAFVNADTIVNVSKQTLQNLERSLLSLSNDFSNHGRAFCKKALFTASRPVFNGIRTDFHLLKTLFQNFDQTTRLDYLRRAFQGSEFWAKASDAHGTFRLASEQVHLMVGLPGVSPAMDPTERSQIESYSTQLKQLMLRELKADLNFFDVPDGSQLLIYQEVAGFPLNYLQRLSELRDSYLQKYTSGDPLHTTCHDKQFADLMILAPEEREALEEAYECFVLGCIFDLIEYRSGDYLWIEKDVFQLRPHPLGDSSMLLLKLSTQPQIRQRLMSTIRDRRGQILTSQLNQNLARYAAVLEWHKQITWGDNWGKKSDESELSFEQAMTLRILKSELDTVGETVLVKAIKAEDFANQIQVYLANLSDHFQTRADNKLIFSPHPLAEATSKTVV
jgi:hypothetical protein